MSRCGVRWEGTSILLCTHDAYWKVDQGLFLEQILLGYFIVFLLKEKSISLPSDVMINLFV